MFAAFEDNQADCSITKTLSAGKYKHRMRIEVGAICKVVHLRIERQLQFRESEVD